MSRTKPQSYPNRRSRRAAALGAGDLPTSSSNGVLSATLASEGHLPPSPVAAAAAPGLLTIREAADVLRVSESTIRNAVGSGRLRAFRFGVRGGSIRIGRADLEDYMASCATVGRPAGRAAGRAGGGLFKSLDADRLLAAWRQQGVFDSRQGEHSAPSSGSSYVP
jgi:excisionase family DNA binding protein